jgi:hypothetical protein
MIELIYASHVAPDLELPQVYHILDHAQANNKAKNITGVLLFNSRYFLQLLEGDEPVVQQLFAAIRQDRRHYSAKLLGARAITKRRWANWSMALITPTAANQSIMMRYSPGQEFSPMQLDAEQASQMLLELSSR